MPSVVATLKIKEEAIEAGKEFLRKLAAETLANEPGTQRYVVHQQRDEPTTFIVYEKYQDDASFAAHSKNLASKAADFAAYLDGRPEIRILDEL